MRKFDTKCRNPECPCQTSEPVTSTWVKRAIARNLPTYAARGPIRADLRSADFGGSAAMDDDYASFILDPDEDYRVGTDPRTGITYAAITPYQPANVADEVADQPIPATHPEWLDEGGSE